ncbi:MAG: hypothetical protein ACRDYY_06610 [Acidimicrobiales bacterium]
MRVLARIASSMCAAAGVAALLIGVSVTPAGATPLPGVYPPPPEGLFVSASQVALGQSLRVTGEGYAPGKAVTLTLHSAPVVLGTAVPDTEGNFDASVTIPSGTPQGVHQVIGSGYALANPNQVLVLTARLTVVASGVSAAAAVPAQVSKAPTSLPFTGFEAIPMLAGALALIVLGSAFVLASRRRRHHRAA